MLIVAALGLTMAGCAAPVAGEPVAAPAAAVAAPTTPASSDGNRRVCFDLDARGGQYYEGVVVPMMAPGEPGQRTLTVQIAEVSRAVAQLRQVGDEGVLEQADGKIADAAEKMTISADAFEVADGANTTALMTAFVELAALCQVEGYKPSWFDANELGS